MTSVRANCLDSSALLKLYVEEDGSKIIREYVNNEPTCYTTPFCYYETLSMLKVKWLYRDEITRDEYLKKSLELTAWFSGVSHEMKDLDLSDISVFSEVKSMAQNHSLDLSDAFQILSVKNGYFSRLAEGSKTILITADKGLANAARTEGLRVWYFMEEPVP